jgi:hypothetical protein
MNINDTITAMLTAFPDWQWLVRSDEEHGAFANFHKPLGPSDDWIDGETCFPCWAATPEEALRLAFEWALTRDPELAKHHKRVAVEMRRAAMAAAG